MSWDFDNVSGDFDNISLDFMFDLGHLRLCFFMCVCFEASWGLKPDGLMGGKGPATIAQYRRAGPETIWAFWGSITPGLY